MRRRDHEPPTPDVLRDLAAMDAALAGTPVPAGGEPVASLAAAVRAARPVPTPAFAAALDRRIAGGRTPARPAGGARRRWLAPAPLIATAGAVVLALVVALNVARAPSGVRSGDSSSGAVVERAAPDVGVLTVPPRTPSGSRPRAVPEGAAGAAPSIGGVPPVGAAPRRVERNATLRLATSPDRLDDLVAGVLRTVDAVGGYVAGSSVERHPASGSATFDLRVPVDRLPTAMARLSRLGAVRGRSEDSLDLTRRVAAATDRTAGLAAERRSLLRQIAAATTPAELARLRTRLRAVEGRLARARAQRDALRRRAAYSTIALDVVARRTAGGAAHGGSGPWTPGDALRDAVRVLGLVAGGLLVGLAALLPLALAALAGWGVARALRRRRRAAALDAAA